MIVLPSITVLVGMTAGAVTAGVVAAPPTPTLAPTRPPAPIKPRVTVARGPRPRDRQTRLSQVVETAVISAPETVVGVASAPTLAPIKPFDPIAPRLTVARGPSPSVTHTASLQETDRDVTSGIETDAPAVVGGVVTVGEPPTPAPRETILPSVFRAPKVTVAEGPKPIARQTSPLQEAEVLVMTSPSGSVVGVLAVGIAGVIPAPILMILPSVLRAPRVTVAEGPKPMARQTAPLQEAEVLVMTSPPGSVVGKLSPEVIPETAPPTPAPRSRIVPSV